MKSILKYALLAVGMALTMSSCYEDVITPGTDPDGPPQAVSFNLDLAPLLKTKCGTDDGCHTQGDHKPFLDNLEQSFVNIKSGGFVNTVVPKESILYKQINGSMAEYIPSKADRQKVFDWIRNGAPNN
jgi:hypothetical protein